MRSTLRRAATVTASLALLTGGAVALAPAAFAVDSSACTHWHQENERVSSNVNFRTGPGTGYTSKGILTSGTDVYVACTTTNWAYVKPLEGAHKGDKGWVSVEYVSGMFNY